MGGKLVLFQRRPKKEKDVPPGSDKEDEDQKEDMLRVTRNNRLRKLLNRQKKERKQKKDTQQMMRDMKDFEEMKESMIQDWRLEREKHLRDLTRMKREEMEHRVQYMEIVAKNMTMYVECSKFHTEMLRYHLKVTERLERTQKSLRLLTEKVEEQQVLLASLQSAWDHLQCAQAGALEAHSRRFDACY